MAHEQNIIPHQFTSEQNREEAAKNGRKGGKASGEAKRRRKAMREALEELLSREYTSKDGSESIDGTALLMTKVFKNASAGDMRAIEFIRDTVGEKPTEKVEFNADIEKARTRIIELVEEVDKELSDNGGNE